MIYFIQGIEGGLVKIGYTRGRVSDRFAQLQPYSPVKLVVRHTAQGSPTTEKLVHRRYAALREHNEWFRPHPDMPGVIGGRDESLEQPERLLDRVEARLG